MVPGGRPPPRGRNSDHATHAPAMLMTATPMSNSAKVSDASAPDESDARHSRYCRHQNQAPTRRLPATTASRRTSPTRAMDRADQTWGLEASADVEAAPLVGGCAGQPRRLARRAA